MFKKKIEFLLAHVKNVSSKYKNIKLFISMKELFPILSTSEWKWFLKKKNKKKNKVQKCLKMRNKVQKCLKMSNCYI